jgi:hypothetical protein
MQIGIDSFAAAISDPFTGLTLSSVERMHHLLEEIELADKVGLDVFGIGEHHRDAYAAMYPDKVERLVVMDAPIPGIDPWNEILQSLGVWHFNFHGPDAERLVAGRERIYFDRIWNDFTGDRPAR